MKICIVVNEYPPDRAAGTAMATHALARTLAARDHAVHVIVTERPEWTTGVAEREPVTVHRLRHGRIPVMRWIIRLRAIRRLVGRIAPDVLHGQSISCGLYAAAAAAGRKIPVLLSIQGQDLYQASQWQRWTEVRWALRAADRLTAVSKDLARRGAALSGRSIDVLPHAFEAVDDVPERANLRTAFGVRDGEFILLCAARLDPIKGVDLLLRALPEVLQSRLWIAGEGPERVRLEALAQSLNVMERVFFLGMLSRRQVAERMRAADLFVLPSRSEALGLSLLEAMHAGLPVVATEVGGVPEVIAKENGILVPPGQPAALAGAIRELRDDPGRRANMAAINAAASQRYRWEVLIESYLKAYQALAVPR